MDDIEFAFRMQEVNEKARAEAIAENKRKYSLAFAETLIELNQPKQKILEILVRSMGTTESEARSYYQEAVAKKD